MDFLQSLYNVQKKEIGSKCDLSFVITQTYLIPEYHKIVIRFSKKKNIMNNYNVKTTNNNIRDISL